MLYNLQQEKLINNKNKFDCAEKCSFGYRQGYFLNRIITGCLKSSETDQDAFDLGL